MPLPGEGGRRGLALPLRARQSEAGLAAHAPAEPVAPLAVGARRARPPPVPMKTRSHFLGRGALLFAATFISNMVGDLVIHRFKSKLEGKR